MYTTTLYHDSEIQNIQEPTESSKQPIRTRYLGHVTGYQPIRCHYFLMRSEYVYFNPMLNEFRGQIMLGGVVWHTISIN